MGLLSVGEPLSWVETKKQAEHIRKHGIQQFLNIYRSRVNRSDQVLLWGDEIEYMVVKFDHENKKVRLALRSSTELLKELQKLEDSGETNLSALWRPEFAAYMIEGTPGTPYGIEPTALEQALIIENKLNGSADNINNIATNDKSVNNAIKNANESGNRSPKRSMFNFMAEIEKNMRLRREEVRKHLQKDECVLSISSFPRTGTYDFCFPQTFVESCDGFSGSLFFPDQAINNGHPRFRTLARNIRERRGENVQINLPIFKDSKTKLPFVEDLFQSMNIDHKSLTDEKKREFVAEVMKRENRKARLDDHVYMDAMGFGMGCCCLQVTFLASNICEARMLYDQLTPLTPILMALSAASPAFRGYLVDLDCRWSVISGAVDDRTAEDRKWIPKSRFDSVDLYIHPANQCYNDIEVAYNKEYYETMVKEGVDELLAKHIAHLFIRDPLVIFKEKLYIDDKLESDHFENIQSTNWQTMRFKPPPPNAQEIGWRVEFRPMEVQLTDEENAAFVIFIVLLTRLILSFNLDLLIPISKVEENMKEAQKRDAATNKQFWFRKDITLPRNLVNHFAARNNPNEESKLNMMKCDDRFRARDDNPYERCEQMSIDQIINGSAEFPGLIPLLNFYLSSMEIDADTRCTLCNAMNLVSKRAKGILPTPAKLIRDFIVSHPQYKQDSVVSEPINYDLFQLLMKLQNDQINLKQFVEIVKQQKEKATTGK